MIEMLAALWGLLVRMATDLGDLWQTALVALLLSMGMTQFLKPCLAKIADPGRHRMSIQAIAFCSACLPVVAAHPDRPGIVAGVLVGVTSPIAYKVASWAVAKRWPDLADALSAGSTTTVREVVTKRKKPSKERAP